MVTEDEDGNEVVEMQEIEETTLTIYLHHTNAGADGRGLWLY